MIFEDAIFNHIKNNFTYKSFPITFGLGSLPETTKTPYIKQHSLDMDGDAQMLCESNNFTSGSAFLQWNVYAMSYINAIYMKKALMEFIAELQYIDCADCTYMIQLNEHSSSPSGGSPNTGVWLEIVARDITYNKK